MIYSTQFWVLFFLVAAIVFVLPTVIGIIRGVDSLGLVVLLNILALVSLGVGWLGAMAFAFGPKHRPRQTAGVGGAGRTRQTF